MNTPHSKLFRKLLLGTTVALLLPIVFARGDDEPKPIDFARQQLLAGNTADALTTIQNYLKMPVGDLDKEVATILEARILFLSKGASGKTQSEALMKSFKPDATNPSVQAELLRLQAVQSRKNRQDEMTVFQNLLQNYPSQYSGYDLYDMTWAQLGLNGKAPAKKKFEKDVIEPVAARLGNSPMVPWSKALLKHWRDDAPEGIELMRQAETGLQEPLLSMARGKEISFLHGNIDNPNRAEQAAALADQVIQAHQVDLKIVGGIAPLMRTRQQIDGMAKWLESEAKKAPTPESVASLWNDAVTEALDVGKADEAQAFLAEATAAKIDPQILATMKGSVAKLVWQIEGQLPKSWLAPDRKWLVEAIETKVYARVGAALATSSVDADATGHFVLPVAGPKMMAVLAYTRPPNAIPILHVLAVDLSAGTPLAIDESKFVRKPLEAPPATDPNTFLFNERFGKDWQPQLVQLHVPKQTSVNPATLRVVDSHGSLPCQYLGDDDKSTIIGVWRGLKAHEQDTLKVSFNDSSIPVAKPIGTVTVSVGDENSQIVDTGPAQFKIPSGAHGDIGKAAAAQYAFVLGVKGPDGVWRGTPGWKGDSAPTHVEVRQGLKGPIRTSFVAGYEFANGAKRTVTFSFDAGQPVMLIDEKAEGNYAGEFQFKFVPTDGFDTFASQLRPGRDMEKLVKRSPQLGFHLSDYPYFSTYLNFMLAGVLSSKPEMKDFVAVFVIHPGDWYDPSYKEAFTPTDEHPEEPWFNPYRYTGSINSAISGTCVETGALTYQIPITPGTRRWAVSITPHDTIKRGPENIWDSQYMLDRYNRGDLSRYVQMVLQWATPLDAHSPLHDLMHDGLMKLQANKSVGLFKSARDATQGVSSGLWGMTSGIQDDDPGMIWLGWWAGPGHEHSDPALSSFGQYAQACVSFESSQDNAIDPVSARGVPNMLMGYMIADELGMLTNEEREQYRADAAIMAYNEWNPDFMNWHMNTGQPNFEVDRLHQLLSFADTFPDHPAAKDIHDHVVRQLKEALRQYTIRDGGKWAENTGNYYLYSFDLVARIALELKLSGGLDDVVSSPYFEPFCRYGMNVVMGRMPPDSNWLKLDSFTPTPMDQWVRFEPGIGSHGGDGGRRIDQYTGMMGQAVQSLNPSLANDLFAFWHSGGDFFLVGKGEFPPDFFFFGEANYPQPPEFTPQPRRMPGFGMVMRDGVNTDREFCMIIHAGTTVYRDEPANGGITLNALGRPLSLIGGEGTIGGGRTNLFFDNKNGGFQGIPRGSITRWLISDAVEYAHGDFEAKPPVMPGAADKLASNTANNADHLEINPLGGNEKPSGGLNPENNQPKPADETGNPGGGENPSSQQEKPSASSETQFNNPDDQNLLKNGKAREKVSRDIIFARNDYVVFHDQHNSENQGYFTLATPAASVEQTPQGTLCHGKLGVDVWLIPLTTGAMPTMLDPVQIEYGNERTTEANMWKQFSVKIPIQKLSDTLLYPVLSGGKPPKTESLGANVWHISSPSFDDVLFTGNASQQVDRVGNVIFQGQIGLLRHLAKGWSFSLVNGTSVSVDGKEFTANAPETIFFDGTSYREVTGNNEPKK